MAQKDRFYSPSDAFEFDLTGQEKDKRCSPPVSEATCKKMLRNQCQPKPGSWDKMQLYSIAKNGENFAGVTPQIFTDYTAEFLLTRGPCRPDLTHVLT
jgi:hypothetical protein